jgi:hypothetical protein
MRDFLCLSVRLGTRRKGFISIVGVASKWKQAGAALSCSFLHRGSEHMQDTVARAPEISVAEALHFRRFEHDSSHSYRYPGVLRRLFDFDQKRNIFIFTLIFCLFISAVDLEYIPESIYYMRKNKKIYFLNFSVAFFV